MRDNNCILTEYHIELFSNQYTSFYCNIFSLDQNLTVKMPAHAKMNNLHFSLWLQRWTENWNLALYDQYSMNETSYK